MKKTLEATAETLRAHPLLIAYGGGLLLAVGMVALALAKLGPILEAARTVGP